MNEFVLQPVFKILKFQLILTVAGKSTYGVTNGTYQIRINFNFEVWYFFTIARLIELRKVMIVAYEKKVCYKKIR